MLQMRGAPCPLLGLPTCHIEPEFDDGKTFFRPHAGRCGLARCTHRTPLQSVTVTGSARRRARRSAASATCRCRARRSAPSVIGASRVERRRHHQPGRHHAHRAERQRRLQRARATGAASRCAAIGSTTASTTAATACRSTPRPRFGSTTRSGSRCCKGTSGMQAGTSAPGGLVNLVVKRPNGTRRVATLGFEERGTYQLALDIGDRAGARRRVRLAHQRRSTNSSTRCCATRAASASGLRRRAATGASAPTRVLEAEVELSRQSQPSQAGFSMLGSTVPDADAIDPRHEPQQPAVVAAGGVRRPHRVAALDAAPVGADWQLRRACDDAAPAHRRPHRVSVRLFSAEGNFDRYCSDGTLRPLRLPQRRANGAATTRWTCASAAARRCGHTSIVGTPACCGGASRPSCRRRRSTSSASARSTAPPCCRPTPPPPGGSARDQRNTERYLRDQWLLTPTINLWLGLRHTRIESADSGSAAIDGVSQHFTTPWLAASWQLDDRTLVYASAGQGIETDGDARTCRTYDNAGQAAAGAEEPASRVRHQARRRPADLERDRRSTSASRCSTTSVPARRACARASVDGQQRHRGIEADATWRGGAVDARGSAHRAEGASAKRSLDPANDGLKPDQRARAQPARAGGLPSARAARAHAQRAAPSTRARASCCPTTAASIPSWTALDLGGALLVQRWAGTTLDLARRRRQR